RVDSFTGARIRFGERTTRLTGTWVTQRRIYVVWAAAPPTGLHALRYLHRATTSSRSPYAPAVTKAMRSPFDDHGNETSRAGRVKRASAPDTRSTESTLRRPASRISVSTVVADASSSICTIGS